MTSKNESEAVIKLDSDLIASAEAYLEKLPKTPSEVVEYWAYLGKAAAEQLTEYEQLLLMSGSGTLDIKNVTSE
ncbi:MAG: hypothetical protein GY738_10810 [Pseudoalteromonas sp.]|nr:hypothetical protein [Pseudoalteromonas sp.]